jgi:hypothetical protein
VSTLGFSLIILSIFELGRKVRDGGHSDFGGGHIAYGTRACLMASYLGFVWIPWTKL